MSTEGANTTTTDDKTKTPDAGAAGGTTTETAAPPAGAQGAAPTTQAEPPPARPSAITLGDDDEIPEGASLLQLSKSALGKRLDRATKKQLKDQFGTDNVEEIKKKLDAAAEYERTKEEQRRAQLTEVERYKEDAAAWRKKHDALEARWKGEKRAQMISSGHQMVTSIAKEFIDPDYLDTELPYFARELAAKYSKDEMDSLGEDAIRAYFKKRVETKPKIGKDFGVTTQQTTEAKPPPPKVPVTNGVRENERPTARTEGSGLPVNGEKDFRPTSANAMSTQEAKQAAAQLGYRW